MGARIFISYRTADGLDKATALARDLGRVFGSDTVFLDKDDLPGGSAWRAEIDRTLQARPVLLLLLTPQLVEAKGPDGRLRIADPADPVRRELEAALEAGAHVVPVLCDGLQALPDSTALPAPFHHIGELTWRKLRAYDWTHDVERLVTDLRALGIEGPPPPGAAAAEAAPVAAQTGPRASASGRRRLALAAGAVAAAAALAWWWWAGRAPADRQAPQGVAGRWLATLSHGEKVYVVISQADAAVTLASEPIPVVQRADWASYRKFWRERSGAELDAVMYRGEGRLVADPGQAPALDVALQVHAVPDSGSIIDSGNLSAALSADRRTLAGTLWLNGDQSSQPARLERAPPAPDRAGPRPSPEVAAPATAPAAPGALPQVRLAGPAEVTFSKFRKSTYRVLGLTAEAGRTGGWRLRVRMRLTAAPNSGGMSFGDSQFRLVIDGVPRAPDSGLNDLVDGGASKDGDITFDVPDGAATLALRILHYDEASDVALALSGAPRAAVAAPPPAGPVALALGGSPDVVFTKPYPATFTVLGVASEARRSGVYGVRVRVRMAVPAGRPAANFWDDQFRLVLDGVPRAPDSRLSLVVEGGAALDGEVTFEVPDAAKSLVLRIQYGADAVADLPLKLEPKR